MILKSRHYKTEPKIRPSSESPSAVIRYIDPTSISSHTLNDHVLPGLSPEEQQNMRKFSNASLAHVYLAAHGLKRSVLAQTIGCLPNELQFESADRGKPMVSGPAMATDWHFNLSHTHALVAVAVSRQPVGIDVENLSRQVPDLDIAKRYFSRREYQHIAATIPGEQARLFLYYWTLKEAFLKAEGWGLSQRLDAVEFDLSGAIGLSVLDSAAQPTQAWRFWQKQPNNTHIMSVALVTDAPDLQRAIDCQPWHLADWQPTH
jgi:4'-phosphopantetheinyl transferase